MPSAMRVRTALPRSTGSLENFDESFTMLFSEKLFENIFNAVGKLKIRPTNKFMVHNY